VPAVDCSTIDPQTARDVAAAAAKQGGHGRCAGLRRHWRRRRHADLHGRRHPELFATLQPVLAQMGRNIVHCEVGTGQIAKICNNLLLAFRWSASAKPWPWAMRWASTPVLAGIINSSTGRCWSSDTYNPWPGIIEPHRPRVATPAASVPN
jgi:3-hydroxyisobutyrate dehydrogenase